MTRQHGTGFIVHCNGALMNWCTKKQCGIETMTMKTCCEYLQGLHHESQMMGIRINGPSHIHGDNKSVLVNSSKPDSVLKKKSLQFCA